MSKKSTIITSAIICAIVAIIVYSQLPSCELCETKINVSKKYDYYICSDCSDSISEKVNSSSNNSSYDYSPSYSSFTNKYGTSTTKCAHSGCSNYIASSGDTNCCTTHSRKCLECYCYIDEDATWCMSCITNALK